MSENYYKKGSWYVHCQRCGFKRHAEHIRKEWTGYLVCADTCWEPRHPQDFVRATTDKQSVPFTNKDPVVFTDVTFGPDGGVIDDGVIDDAVINGPETTDPTKPY